MGINSLMDKTAKKRGPPKGLKKMEHLLEQLQPDDIAETSSHNAKRKRSISDDTTDRVEKSTKETPPSDYAKVVRYHGSSSGYYLVSNILCKEDTTSEKSENELTLPTANGQGVIRMRKMTVYDDDMVVMRDKTEDEHKFQLEADSKEKDVAPRPVIEALIQAYFRYDHPTLPILDKTEFLNAFEGRTEHPPPPLLTYAICAHTCFTLLADDPLFKHAGVDRNEVFEALLERSSELIRREYLTPRLATIQALMLLCGHPTLSTDTYRNWVRAGMAVRMAQDLGLHRTLVVMPVSEGKQELLKRLWYNRWCCAAMGRPLAIADSDCDIDLPQMIFENEDHTIFVNFIKLSGILGEVLRRIYSPKAKVIGYKSLAMQQTVRSIQRMLTKWFEELPDNCRADPETYPSSSKVRDSGSLAVCYYAVTILLHRPFIVLENDPSASDIYEEAARRCTNAAKTTIDFARRMDTLDIVHFGWNFSAYAIFQAVLIHVYNTTSSDPLIAKSAREYVQISLDECITPITKDIPHAPPAKPFIQNLLKLTEARTEDDRTKRNTELSSNRRSSNSHPPTVTASPMSVHQIVSGLDNQFAADTPTPVLPTISPSSTYNANLHQLTWQQLFSTAGTPFTDRNTGIDLQGNSND
ncbi:hypothetical protein EC973_003731 [Apophysomyces ossiformis]|uniref:Xylanolytic transcriptional activator regulatory domain-containing protein n=1 Tax=Apophysomyces ossiformis TaxID=679940 RepID=A0A8H7BGW3_9FUNG|nr:hypothetical protein EC973_003731 [Apophysomyces ossiformis]